MTSRNIDILALTETWLGTTIDAKALSEVVPPSYDILHVARPDKRDGGVAVLFREGLVLNIIQSTKDGIFTQFLRNYLSSTSFWTESLQSYDVFRRVIKLS